MKKELYKKIIEESLKTGISINQLCKKYSKGKNKVDFSSVYRFKRSEEGQKFVKKIENRKNWKTIAMKYKKLYLKLLREKKLGKK